MQKLWLTAMLVALSSFASYALADERDFTIVNDTGYEISFIGGNPPGDNDFGENELEEGLAQGEEIEVSFDAGDKGCLWNFKVKWTGYSKEVLFEGLDLCTITRATLQYDRETRKTTALIE